MKSTGRFCPIEDVPDLDHRINEVVEHTQTFIRNLIREVGAKNYRKIAKVIINEHLEYL